MVVPSKTRYMPNALDSANSIIDDLDLVGLPEAKIS